MTVFGLWTCVLVFVFSVSFVGGALLFLFVLSLGSGWPGKSPLGKGQKKGEKKVGSSVEDLAWVKGYESRGMDLLVGSRFRCGPCRSGGPLLGGSTGCGMAALRLVAHWWLLPAPGVEWSPLVPSPPLLFVRSLLIPGSPAW